MQRRTAIRRRPTWSRRLGRTAPVLVAVVGMLLVFAAVVSLDPGNTNVGIAVVTVGLFSLLMGMWYAANPYLRGERRHPALRAEVVGFIGMVRQLDAAACAGQSERVRELTAEMHESVDRMREVAGQDEPVTRRG